MRAHHRTGIVVTAAVVVIGLLLVELGCGRGPAEAREGAEPPLVLRSYSVDPGIAPELASVLAGLLSLGNDVTPYGRVRQGPNGQILVAAPASFQEGVEDVIEELRTSEPAPPRVVHLTYWVVVGSSGEEAAWPRRLDEVSQALEAVVGAEGPTRFDLVEKLELRSLTGERAEVAGRAFSISQTAGVRQGRIFADVRVHSLRGRGGVETKVNIRPDQTLVVGRSGVPEVMAAQDDHDATLFVLVRAAADEGPAS